MRFFILLFTLSFPVVASAAPSSVYLEDLTSPETKRAIASGYTTAIIPTGGTEQNGPHMVLGKHNYIVKYTSGEIAKKLGNALVAPVITYVPEGNITPPEGHMNFAGTLSISEDTFENVLEDTTRSLKQHGFKTICFIGDSGGNQQGQKNVAGKLSDEWEDEGVKVLHISDYYDLKASGQEAWFAAQKLTPETVGFHAGIADTSELLATHPQGIRKKLLAKHTDADYPTSGATGDSTKASAEIGKELLKLKITAAVKQIQAVETSR